MAKLSENLKTIDSNDNLLENVNLPKIDVTLAEGSSSIKDGNGSPDNDVANHGDINKDTVSVESDNTIKSKHRKDKKEAKIHHNNNKDNKHEAGISKHASTNSLGFELQGDASANSKPEQSEKHADTILDLGAVGANPATRHEHERVLFLCTRGEWMLLEQFLRNVRRAHPSLSKPEPVMTLCIL